MQKYSILALQNQQMQKEARQDWYTSWFDSPYYHILYKDRDYDEAESFMKRLSNFLELKEGDTILDLACGKGRHSISLNKMGFHVTGVDLSASSIDYAKKFETKTLHFEVHDMCLPYSSNFDAVFNLFTSFGYFDAEEDNLRTLKAIKANLKEHGRGVIDFMNVHYVTQHLVPLESKTIDGIIFSIERYVEDNHIIKKIAFEYNGISYRFTERVKALTLDNFRAYFEAAGLTLLHCFGNYNLEPYHEATSDRLILIFE